VSHREYSDRLGDVVAVGVRDVVRGDDPSDPGSHGGWTSGRTTHSVQRLETYQKKYCIDYIYDVDHI
jgi:hypothetical protein